MNQTIFYSLYNLAHQSAAIDKVIVFLAVYLPYVVVFLAAVFLVMHHEVFKAETPFAVFSEKKKEIFLVFFSGALAWFIAFTLKFLFNIPRPFVSMLAVHPLFMVNGFSFPSEHAMFFSALTFEIFLLHKKAGYLFIFLAVLIGLARVAAGVHFPADILVGFLFGFFVAYLVRKALT